MILVTGGAGFIGSNLVRRLLDEGEKVIALDDFSTGSDENLPNNKNLIIVQGSVIELVWPTVVREIALQKGAITEIYHLACPASPKAYQSDPLFTLKTNVLGTYSVLRFALDVGAKMVFTSTSEVYGDPLVTPQKESYWGHVNSIGPRACYDEGKRCAETFCVEWAAKYGVDVKIARIFNTYGPNMAPDDGRVVSNFIMQALKNEPLTIYGTGKQTRSFCYVDDTVDALMKLMASDERGPMNIGNPHEIELYNLVRRLGSVLKRELEVMHAILPQDDPKQRCPDISLAMDRLGWEPHVTLNEGLRRTVEYFKRYTDTSDQDRISQGSEILSTV